MNSASAHPLAKTLRNVLMRLATHRDLYAVCRSAAQVFAIRFVGAGLTYASMVFLARWLGPFDFGIYAYVFVIVALLGLALSLGFSSSALRFVSDYLARGKWRRLIGFLVQSYGIVLSVSVLGGLLGIAVVVALRARIEPHYAAPLMVGMLCVPLWALLNQSEATARAFGCMHLAYIPGYIVRPLALMMFVGGAFFLHGMVGASGAVWGMFGACSIAALSQALLLTVHVRRRVTRPAARHCHTRHWLAISLGFLMVDGFRMLLDNADVLMIGRFLDPDSVAVYFAVIRTAGLVTFVSFSMIALAVPKFAKIHRTGTRAEMQRFVSGITQLMFWPSLLAALALALAGPWVLALFGAAFGVGYPTMLVVLGGLVLRSATGPVEHLLNMTGHHGDTLRVYAVCAVLNVALNMALIPALGILGAAIATNAAILTCNIWLFILVRKRLGVNAFVVPLATVRQRSSNTGEECRGAQRVTG
ncbi:MAG: lipopolysaccharide biosynthesis protein [Variibacter sp.]